MANDFRRGIKVYLDATEYKQGIDEMVAITKKLEGELQQLAVKGENLSREEIKRKGQLTREINKNTASVATYRERMKETERVLRNLSGATYNELIRVQQRLDREIRDAKRGTVQYTSALSQHALVSKQLTKAKAEMTLAIGASGSAFERASLFMNKYFLLIGSIFSGITALSMTFRKLAEDVAKMDDVYANVMKTTGLTREEVAELNEELKKMNTRTSREELNKLAVEAGKLGITGSKNILDFVEAGNQIRVALGEDLGEDAIKSIGKMVGVFEKSTGFLRKLGLKEQMLAVGSAVNELGMSSSASEEYLVQFAGRLGGVSSQAGISIDAILGFGSALDQNMQHVEMSATALQNFIMKVMGEPAKFARIAGMNVREFTSLLRYDANSAIKEVLRSLNEKGGFQKLIPIFNDMGLDGARAVGVLSSLASNIHKVDEAQRIANHSLVKGSSITTEYNIKNENLAAKLEKARKEFKEASLTLGESLSPALLKSTNITTHLIRLITSYPAVIKTMLIAVGLLTAAYAAKYAVQLKNFVLDKSEIILTKARTVSTLALAAAKAGLGGHAARAAVHMRSLGAVLGTNPYIAAAGAVIGLGIAVYKLATRTSEAEKAEISMLDALAKEQVMLNGLIDAYRDVNASNQRKLEIIAEMESKYGIYLDDLKDEEGLLINIEGAQLRANKALQDGLALKFKNQAIDSAQEEFIKEQQKNTETFYEKLLESTKSDYKAEQLLFRVNEMFRSSGVDVNKTFRVAANLLRENGVTVNREMESAMHKMVASANKLNVAKNQAEKTFNRFMGTPDNILDPLVVTPRNSFSNGSGYKSNSGNSGGSSSRREDPSVEAIKKQEEYYKKQLLSLKYSLLKKQITEEEFDKKSEKLFLDFLYKKKKIEKKFHLSSVDTDMEIADLKLANQKTLDEKLLEKLQRSSQARLNAAEEVAQLEKQLLQDQVDDGIITTQQYNARLAAIELDAARLRLHLAESHLALVKNAEFSSAETKTKAVEEAADAVKAAAKDEERAVKISNRAKLKADEEYQTDRRNLLKELGFLSIREQYNEELKELKTHLEKKLLTEEEYERAVRQLKLKHAEGYAQSAVQFAGYVADAVTAYHQTETDSLEAQKQRELTAAGDNAEAREKIEKDYAQKELDLKKKQSLADAGIKIAQTISAGALAGIQAFAQLGPVGGAVAAALIATTTAFQIASIIRQRNAILATTLDSSVSGSSKTGKLVARQAAEGRWSVLGEDDGVTYRNVPYRGIARTGYVLSPTLVGERGDELVVDNPTLRNIRMNAPYILSEIMRLRVPQRAEGKYDSGMGTSINDPMSELISRNTAVMANMASFLRSLQENGVKAPIVLSELEKKQALSAKSKKIGTM